MQVETEIPRKHRWTHDEYLQAHEPGWFESKRTELIEGEIVYTPTMQVRHFQGVFKTDQILHEIFFKGFFVAVRCPIKVGEISDPEPDVAVIEGKPEDFKDAFPTTAALVIEIADSSLAYDRTEKAGLYAKAGVPDYWIVNIKDRRLEVRRRPVEDSTAVFGYSYSTLQMLAENETVSPPAKPEAEIKIADLLP